ncbi:MAG: hypothetical protein AAF485_22055 [Chloroflexota bacterium]
MNDKNESLLPNLLGFAVSLSKSAVNETQQLALFSPFFQRYPTYF